MRCRPLNLLTALSQLLFVAVCVLWVRSYEMSQSLGWINDQGDGCIVDCRARGRGVEWQFRRVRPSDGSERHFSAHSREHNTSETWTLGVRPSWAGFGVEMLEFPLETAGGAEVTMTWHGVLVPHWALLAVFGSVPALYAWKALLVPRTGRLRAAKGLCCSCGYDLRATPGRCPECGISTSPSPST